MLTKGSIRITSPFEKARMQEKIMCPVSGFFILAQKKPIIGGFFVDHISKSILQYNIGTNMAYFYTTHIITFSTGILIGYIVHLLQNVWRLTAPRHCWTNGQKELVLSKTATLGTRLQIAYNSMWSRRRLGKVRALKAIQKHLLPYVSTRAFYREEGGTCKWFRLTKHSPWSITLRV